MNLKQLEAFITVAREGSFSKAAQQLYTSPTALTQQLNALERYLQCAVFDRTYRGVRLTPAGEAFLPYAQKLYALADEAVAQCRASAGLFRQSIVIGCYRELEMNFLRPYLARFAEICPDVTVQFRSADYRTFFDLLKNRELDLFIHPHDPYIEKNGFCFQKLGTTTICCNMWEQHSLAHHRSISAADLRGEHVIISCGCKSRALDRFIDYLRVNEPSVLLQSFHTDDEIWANVFTRNYLMISLSYSNQPPQGCVSVPLQWPETIDYGFIHQPEESIAVRRFLASCKSLLS